MAGKAPCVNVREHSGMVDVGVGQKYIVYLRPGYGWFYVFIDIEALQSTRRWVSPACR